MNSILLNPLHIAGNVHLKTERESMLGSYILRMSLLSSCFLDGDFDLFPVVSWRLD